MNKGTYFVLHLLDDSYLLRVRLGIKITLNHLQTIVEPLALAPLLSHDATESSVLGWTERKLDFGTLT